MTERPDPVTRRIHEHPDGTADSCHLMGDQMDEALCAGGFHRIRSGGEDIRREVRIRPFRNLGRGAFDGPSPLGTCVQRIGGKVAIDFVRMAHQQTLGMDHPSPRQSIVLGRGSERVDNREPLKEILQPSG